MCVAHITGKGLVNAQKCRGSYCSGITTVRFGGFTEQTFQRCIRNLCRLQFFEFIEHCIFCRFQNAVESMQNNHRLHDQAILRKAVRVPESIRDFPNFGFDLAVNFDIHQSDATTSITDLNIQHINVSVLFTNQSREFRSNFLYALY